MKFARIINSSATDVLTSSPEGFFTPEIAAQFVQVPEEVQNGWRLVNGVWTAPPPAPAPAPVAPEAPKISPVEFKLLFTSPERVAIKAARATDAAIDDFYSIVEDPRLTFVDLGLQSTKDAIAYLQAKNLLTAARATAVLAGRLV